MHHTINLVKLFDFESILAFKIEIIVPSIQESHLCEKWAWDASSMVEFEAIDNESYSVEQSAGQEPLQEWDQHLDHGVIVERVEARFVKCFR